MMSPAVHLISKPIPGYGPSDSGMYFPCSGVPGRVLTVPTCLSNTVCRSYSQRKIPSLKCAAVEASFACRADSKRNPDFSKHSKHGFSRGRSRQSGERYVSDFVEESDMLSSKNGQAVSLSGSPKYQTTAAPGPREREIVELFRKVQAQLRERAAVKEEKKMEALQGQSKENETVDSLLKLLRKHSVEHGKKNNKNESSGGGDGDRNFISDQSKPNGSGLEEKPPGFSSSNSILQEESEESSISSARPRSKFRRKSPVPSAKSTPTFSEKATPNSLANLNAGKRPGLTDTLLEPELQLQSEEEPEPEPKPQPELLNELNFSDELEFEGVEISANDVVPDDEDRVEQRESRDLTALKLTELRSLAKSCGVKGFSKMKKGELVEMLSQSSL